MTVFSSKISIKSDSYRKNRDDMLALVSELREIESRAMSLSEKRRARFEERGQLTPRERLKRLLDPGMPFLELFNLANFLVDNKNRKTSVPGASMLVGIGFVSGVRSMVMVDDSGINAGAMTGRSLQKGLWAARIIFEQKLPFIHLVESAGANLMSYQVEQWAAGGGMFFNLARMSAAGIPTFTILHGPSTAGGAYQPGMSDYVIGVKKNGMAALGGAALVKAATGEETDDQTLGGVEMHASTTGLVEYLAEDDAHGIQIQRDLIKTLDWNKNCATPPTREFPEPLYDADQLACIVPIDAKVPYDVREVVTRLVDGSDFSEFKPRYGPATVCIRANIFGHAVGIVGNNGPIDPDGATKAAQFMQLCDSADIPLIFLNNTTGYMVGKDYEHAGMIKHGSKMIQATSNVSVPKISLYIGASFGAGNYGMCGYAYEPDFLFAWPNSTSGVMGGEQAARTMAQVMTIAAERRGQPIDPSIIEGQKAALTKHFDDQHSAFYTSGQVLDQGVIDPRDTRKVLGFCLETIWEGRNRSLKPNSFGIARM